MTLDIKNDITRHPRTAVHIFRPLGEVEAYNFYNGVVRELGS